MHSGTHFAQMPLTCQTPSVAQRRINELTTEEASPLQMRRVPYHCHEAIIGTQEASHTGTCAGTKQSWQALSGASDMSLSYDRFIMVQGGCICAPPGCSGTRPSSGRSSGCRRARPASARGRAPLCTRQIPRRTACPPPAPPSSPSGCRPAQHQKRNRISIRIRTRLEHAACKKPFWCTPWGRADSHLAPGQKLLPGAFYHVHAYCSACGASHL